MSQRVSKIYKDRDYLEVEGGLFFCVVGYVHPPNRVNAYLKYSQAPGGAWGEGEKRYKRMLPYYTVHHLKETLAYLRKERRDFVFTDPETGLEFSSVPVEKIARHYCPEDRLRELVRNPRRDALEEGTVRLAAKLSRRSRVPIRYLGVTGSIMINIHRPDFSDIDLVIYGRSNSVRIKETLLSLFKDPASGFERFKGGKLKEWSRQKAEHFPLTEEEAEELYGRIWNRGLFEGTYFSVHPVRANSEIAESYGQRRVKQEGVVEVEAVVADASEAIFLPAIYGLEDVKIIKGVKVEDLLCAVSHEGLYGDIAGPGEKIIVKGVLEEVVDRKRRTTYHQVSVGSLKAQGKDYIKILSP